jgi:hypothetical protein
MVLEGSAVARVVVRLALTALPLAAIENRRADSAFAKAMAIKTAVRTSGGPTRCCVNSAQRISMASP